MWVPGDQPIGLDWLTLLQGSIDEHQKLLDLMQEHICRTIGHFIVFIGSRVGVRILPGVQRLIVDASPAEWRVAASGACSPSIFQLCGEGPPKYTFAALEHACKREWDIDRKWFPSKGSPSVQTNPRWVGANNPTGVLLNVNFPSFKLNHPTTPSSNYSSTIYHNSTSTLSLPC